MMERPPRAQTCLSFAEDRHVHQFLLPRIGPELIASAGPDRECSCLGDSQRIRHIRCVVPVLWPAEMVVDGARAFPGFGIGDAECAVLQRTSPP
jgi:hypothetical protein